jgi:AraC-like DNA-binding protein
MVQAFTALGYDRSRLMVAAGLDVVTLDDPDARVPCETYETLVTHAQRERFTPNIGVELARHVPIGAYPLLDYLILTSDTVGAGLRHLQRYFQLTGSPMAIEIREDPDQVRVLAQGPQNAFSVEFFCGLMVLDLRIETNGAFFASRVSFMHTPDDVRVIEGILRCPVEIGSTWNGVAISPAQCELPFRRRDPVLRGMLERLADAIIARLPKVVGIAADVQRVLASHQVGTDLAIGAVARQLVTSPRTLQRRLAAEGTSYQGVVDRWRKEAAAQHIAEGTLPICEIAYLLGYSEPASFHRAFRRWYHTTPEMYRRTSRTASGV